MYVPTVFQSLVRNYKRLFGFKNGMRTFTAMLQKEEDLFVATCPELGTVSQGRTVEDAVQNLKEATELYLETTPATAKAKPILTTFEVGAVGNI